MNLSDEAGNMISSEFKPNRSNKKILTEKGYVSFKGIQKSTHASYVNITFNDGSNIMASNLHQFFMDGVWVTVDDLEPLMTISGKTIFSLEIVNEQVELFDIIGSDTGTYYTNGVLSHNCAFISDKGTLVNSMVIEQLKHESPKSYFGEDLRIFVDTLAGRTLAMACDVSEGIGQDYHAIQIMDLDTFEQVAEFQNNILTQTQYVKEIIKIMEFLYNEGIEELYYTIEANSIGQGVMRLIENSENDFLNRSTLISEPDGRRLGLLTSPKSKLAGCMELKDMIEMHKINIKSARLITELKFFIRKGASFGAEPGTHDDLVMAMVLMMNMLTQLTNYEDNVYDMVNEIDGLDVDEETWGIF